MRGQAIPNFDLDRRAFLLCLTLAGCDFVPALGTNGPARGLLNAVRARDPMTQDDYDFVARIEERLGRPTASTYDLAYSITTTSEGVGITASGSITRYSLAGRLTWVLSRNADGLRMAGGTVDNFTSYSATGSVVAGLTAKQDASRRLMRILADQVVSGLMAHSADFAP